VTDTKQEKYSHPKGQQSSQKQAFQDEKAAHTPSTKPCFLAENCVNALCTFTHPASRPPTCPDAGQCTSSLCLRLHPPQDLEVILLKKATHGLGGHYKAIATARIAHKEKLNAVAVQSFRLLQQAPEASLEKRLEQSAIRQAVEAQALELSQQLRNFDIAVLQCIECITTTSDEAGALLSTKKDQNDLDNLSKMHQKHIKSLKRRLFREIYRLNFALPALSLRREIETKVTESQFVVIQGATGSG
jgi:hypothetical protein